MYITSILLACRSSIACCRPYIHTYDINKAKKYGCNFNWEITYNAPESVKVLNIFWITSNRVPSCNLFFFGNKNLLIIFVAQPKSWPFWVFCIFIVYVGPRRWVFFHITLHPLRKLPFIAKSKPSSFCWVWPKTAIHTISWFPRVFWLIHKSISFWHAIGYNRLLQSGCALLVENFCIIKWLLSPKSLLPAAMEGKMILYLDLSIAKLYFPFFFVLTSLLLDFSYSFL